VVGFSRIFPEYNESMPESSVLLSQAIQAARSGQRAQALQMLIDIVDQDPNNAQAWIHLSQLVEDEEDQLIAIENALALLPGDEDLLSRRETHLLAHPHLRRAGLGAGLSDQLAQAQQLVAQKKYNDAISLLRHLVSQYPGSDKAWLALADLEPGLPERALAVEKVLKLDPRNPDALRLLEQVQKEQKNLFQRGQYLEEQGEFDRAAEVYLYIVTHSRLATQRLEARRRLENIDLRQEAQHIHPVHPTLNLTRLAAGPILLFLILLFMQSGLNVAHLSLLALPEILSVVIGSLLVALTEMIPAHPKWIAWYGQPGSGDEPEMRRGMRLLGLALMIAPFTIFMIEAGARLGTLQSNLLSGMR
jgi:tetratricopeptide (TPR) repeat protein